jgi:hypothetical protein
MSWSEASVKINRALDQIEKIRKDLEHIEKPYDLFELLDKYSSGDYNAELLLQHAMLLLVTAHKN